MILGIGTDIVEIERMIKSIENTGFLSRYFTDAENEYFMLKRYSPQTISGCFAAKEAVSKAFGTGFCGFSLKDIEILHDKLKKPYVKLYNNALNMADGATIHLSITHTQHFACAYVIMEK